MFFVCWLMSYRYFKFIVHHSRIVGVKVSEFHSHGTAKAINIKRLLTSKMDDPSRTDLQNVVRGLGDRRFFHNWRESLEP